MTTLKVGQRGVITLPKKLRDTLGIAEASMLSVREKSGTLILEPQRPSDDALLADIRKGLREIRRGEYIEFGSISEFHEKLKKYAD